MTIDLEAAEKLADNLYLIFVKDNGVQTVKSTIRDLVAGLRAAEAEVRRLQVLVVEQGDAALAAMDECDEARRLLAVEQTKTAFAREALEWYADPVTYEINDADGYIPDAHIPIFDHDDGGGKRAREAIAKIDGR